MRVKGASSIYVFWFFAVRFILFYKRAKKNGVKAVTITDDANTSKYSLLSAAKALGLGTVLFRMERSTKRFNPKFIVSYIALWNENQAKEDRMFCKNIVQIKPNFSRNKSGFGSKCKSIGVVIGANTRAGMVSEVTNELLQQYPDYSVTVRPHPNGLRQKKQELIALGIEDISSPEEAFDDFCAKLDLVISNGSSAVLEIVANGTPVVIHEKLMPKRFSKFPEVKPEWLDWFYTIGKVQEGMIKDAINYYQKDDVKNYFTSKAIPGAHTPQAIKKFYEFND